jgi:hypothetical protein
MYISFERILDLKRTIKPCPYWTLFSEEFTEPMGK